MSEPRTLLVVDDERNMRMVMQMALEEAGYRVLTAERGDDAVGLLRDPDLAVVLSDLKMPGLSGGELIARIQQERPEVPVIVITAYGSIRSAVECIQAGASDYLTKPFEPEELQFAVRSALRLHDLMRENRQLQARVSDAQRSARLVGEGPAMQRLREQIGQVAPYKTNILVTGESGTGKEAVARAIHETGPRADRPWVAINCSAIPRDLMESELFGYVKGAFTGAARSRLGRLEQADGGTLFLDEIGDLEPPLQAKLLRVLQEREFSPLGSDAIRRVDVRIIAATNRDLAQLVAEGQFREDLLYRLDVYNIRVPPLRERREDIPLLAAAFLDELRAEMGKPATGFTNEALSEMARHDWPGNVRELRNAVERSLLSCRDGRIQPEDLPDRVRRGAASNAASPAEEAPLDATGLDDWLAEAERRRIVQALEQTDGIQVQAARLLGISERSLWHRLKKLDIRVDRSVRG
ncbi:sigma-54-dependent transcriptional regulator [Imhoffiella purpurea]|uniref:Sigma-54 dependent DNA-binding response regulator n=1 Tax=Imhoffiella purpurea TaxID=1249627 RepID=W9VAU3_9GAMM|nr:sigma-54 dependent transcriptional regulator [Imhoffiella purpurea]EXJ16564.1 sigma-54 dependent DNA-binding response regulator [Imhoffiella purpurea]